MSCLKMRFCCAIVVISVTVGTSGCVGSIIAAATDATLAVAEAPFKVGGAIIDVVDGDDD